MRVENWPLMERSIRRIKDDPRLWNQGSYAVETDCGTAYCVAGHAIAESGYQFVRAAHGLNDYLVVIPEDSPLAEFAGWSDYYRVMVSRSPDVAARLLGMNNIDSGKLFYAHRLFCEILEMVKTWADEDGYDWPADLTLTPEQAARLASLSEDPLGFDSDEADQILMQLEDELLGTEAAA